ncbi:AraC family transcriptional regulator [Poseidonibacter lekithochrous]|uniref:helix-turn-helix domain-containing protein n=1 Tax=Poseidonibacter TaxID=2321187 RepID=UPI001C09DD9F|nr:MULTISPECIES: AraC family transcriptional regulator [Poseidonibacter]MBU3015017.1 AraC family transcriptional regulator [Poseidonibacter lekithochrous]MDO6828314.1 AraC family transcriptional regulator [Poseidonibacter sp. 1_MG-2023]
MTYVVPNYFIENKYSNLLKIDNLLCLNYISKTKNSNVYARTTMHSMGIMLEGSKVIHLSNEDITIEKNDIFFLTQNNYYMSERVADDSKYKSLLVYFDDKFIFDFINKYNIKINIKNEQSIVKASYKSDKLFENSVQTFQEYLKVDFNENLLKLKIEEMFLQAIKHNEKQMYSFFNSILATSQDRIKYILESNIDLIQTLDDMCSITRLSENKIRRYIKKEFNQTPKIWLDTKRLEKAVLLLNNTNKSISDISTTCGYSTVSWFISQFKKYHKQTPKEFRYKI